MHPSRKRPGLSPPDLPLPEQPAAYLTARSASPRVPDGPRNEPSCTSCTTSTADLSGLRFGPWVNIDVGGSGQTEQPWTRPWMASACCW